MSFNKIIIVGNLGRDPEMRQTPQGKAVCNLAVATSEKRKDANGESKEETTWFNVTFWERQAEIANQYLKKGNAVYIEGRLQAREWTDKQGRVRTRLDVTGTELKLLGNREEETNSLANERVHSRPTQGSFKTMAAKKAAANMSKPDINDGDIPF